ncbi:MAG: trehalase family glycosidase [Candidatus Dojkabacteria bacterium]|nr:trehalase family glycosidase [Candidatus Dojkabacteria bacterium]MDQ7020472.1 trehalase family glycosidase [Candidatus Dojkabacteria bacterium]
MTKSQEKSINSIKLLLAADKVRIKKRANGSIQHDYLVPGGYYEEQWDWDAFFMGVGLTAEIPSEAIYLKNWALNYIKASNEEGFAPGCVTPKGEEQGHRWFLMKPFLAQGISIASKNLNEFEWIKPFWNKIKKMVMYREKHRFSKKYGLVILKNSMETGADDNVASLNFADDTVISADMNTYTYREYKAMAILAKKLNKNKDHEIFSSKAKSIKANMNKYMWDKNDKIYYNIDISNGEKIKRITFSSFVPLWEVIPTQKNGEDSIKKYILDPKHLFSKYGIRTLSKSDPEYNNVNRIKPYSNWQGPIWPIANYIYLHALLKYGFKKQAEDISIKIMNIVAADFKMNGGIHENYDAETGNPLAAPNFVSWNLLVGNMLSEVLNDTNPFEIK